MDFVCKKKVSVLSVGKLTVFNRFVEIFAYKYGPFSPKIVEKKCQSLFPAILRQKKVPITIKLKGGGGKGLNGTAMKKDPIFCGFPYRPLVLQVPRGHRNLFLNVLITLYVA